jgi:hypothetical protein
MRVHIWCTISIDQMKSNKYHNVRIVCMFVDRCFSFCPYSIVHGFDCPSSIYGFFRLDSRTILTLWYLLDFIWSILMVHQKCTLIPCKLFFSHLGGQISICQSYRMSRCTRSMALSTVRLWLFTVFRVQGAWHSPLSGFDCLPSLGCRANEAWQWRVPCSLYPKDGKQSKPDIRECHAPCTPRHLL